MQQITSSKTPPSYLEKVTLYFHPQGWIVVTMGNQRVHATPEEVEKLIGNRLAHHAQYAALFAEVHKNHEQDL